MTNDNNDIQDSYHGSRYSVTLCSGAMKSFKKALSKVKSNQQKKCIRVIANQIERLANGEEMAKEHFPQEALLPPNRFGKKSHFYAIKRIPLRGYCWFSERVDHTIFISHFIYKKRNDLHPNDTEKVHNAWRRIEENGDDS